MGVLTQLQPQRVFAIFEQICAIPHGSGNTEAISRFCYDFACRRGWNAHRDTVGNVLVKKEGSAGREGEPPVILQAHLDMVCEKSPDKTFDFFTQPIPVMTDGTFVWADGTTLGADNGIGLAMILALLEESPSHPPLEGIFTIDEETGLEGAAAVDLTPFDGERMINLDSEDEGIFTVGCAGGIRVEATFPLTFTPAEGTAYSLQIKGLLGGHSGIEIHKARANACRELAFWVQELATDQTVTLASFTGGTVDNAIAAEAGCVVVTSHSLAFLQNKAREKQAELQAAGEQRATVTVEQTILSRCMSEPCSRNVLSFLTAVPNGVRAMCNDLPDLVETSLNMGVVRQTDTALQVTVSLRSAVQTKKEELLALVKKIAEQYGAATTTSGAYPGWEYRSDSRLQESMKRVYRQIYGTEPAVDVIHAGLECGLFCEKRPTLDAVSIGPNMTGVHTPDERVEVASVERVYAYLLQLLANI